MLLWIPPERPVQGWGDLAEIPHCSCSMCGAIWLKVNLEETEARSTYHTASFDGHRYPSACSTVWTGANATPTFTQPSKHLPADSGTPVTDQAQHQQTLTETCMLIPNMPHSTVWLHNYTYHTQGQHNMKKAETYLFCRPTHKKKQECVFAKFCLRLLNSQSFFDFVILVVVWGKIRFSELTMSCTFPPPPQVVKGSHRERCQKVEQSSHLHAHLPLYTMPWHEHTTVTKRDQCWRRHLLRSTIHPPCHSRG